MVFFCASEARYGNQNKIALEKPEQKTSSYQATAQLAGQVNYITPTSPNEFIA